MKMWNKFPIADIAAVLLGALLTLSFAPFMLFPLAIISPALLLVLWLNTSPARAFWLGWLFGIGLFSTGVYWIFHSVNTFGGVPAPLAIFITAGLIAILSLFIAVAGYLTNRLFPFTTTTKLVCAFPAIWVFSEWFRSTLFTGFPWLLIGYSQTNSPLSGYAPIIGVYGISLAVLMTSGLIVNAILQFQQKFYRQGYYCLLAFVTIWIVGGLLSLIMWTEPSGQPVSVSLVQGNIPQALKWSPEHIQLSLDQYEKLTEPLWKKDNLIIWPEAAVPLPLQIAAGYIQKLSDKAEASGANLILGIPVANQDDTGYYNAIITLGKERQFYNKRHLVPFGEYTPAFFQLASILKFMDIPMSDMVPGKFEQNPLQLGGIRILPSICYEIAFPELNQTRDASIGALLTITNDAWFGESSAQAQHLQMAQMRALELRRPVIFVSNDGITALIDAKGKIDASAPPHEAYVLSGKVQAMIGYTPWMRNGLDPVLVILIGLLVAGFRENKKKRA